jgi:hypothetical protein
MSYKGRGIYLLCSEIRESNLYKFSIYHVFVESPSHPRLSPRAVLYAIPLLRNLSLTDTC